MGVDIYCGITFRQGGDEKGGKEVCLFVFWWLWVLSFILHAYRQDLTRLLNLALEDQGILHSKAWQDTLYSTTLLNLWLLSKGGSSNGVSSDVHACPQKAKLKHLSPISVRRCLAHHACDSKSLSWRAVWKRQRWIWWLYFYNGYLIDKCGLCFSSVVLLMLSGKTRSAKIWKVWLKVEVFSRAAFSFFGFAMYFYFFPLRPWKEMGVLK